ncbi:hypothetical protein, partial [uncultured Megasphaera sp.]|uniref:hypothetical protein n=1 Tax=uncultured Megasphaera sp. TaxID=165188 RepID=UPI002622FFEF
MSGKKCKRELLRALVLGALLSTAYLGAAAANYPLTGDTIEGTHELPALENLYKLDGEQKVTALSDVTVVSKSTDEGKSAVIISSTDSADSSLDLDMNGHSLAIDAKTSGIYITKDNTNVNIHNADSIETTVDYHNFVAIQKGNGSSVNFQANNMTFNKSEVYADNPIFAVGNKNELIFNAGNDIIFNNKARANSLSVYYGTKLQMEAGHDITFNHTYSDTAAVQGLPIVYLGAGTDTTIHAGNDINFNRNQYAFLLGMQNEAKAVIKADGNINFHEEAPSYPFALAIQNKSDLTLEAQHITGNMQQMVTAINGSQVSLKANEINWIAEGVDMSAYAGRYPDKASMIVASRNDSKVELQADKDIYLSTGVPHTLLYASDGSIALNGGNSIYLHSAGQTDDPSQANLRAQDGNIDLTSGGVIAVENEGATAAYAVYTGTINFNGKTIISGAGKGALSEAGGKINFNGKTAMSGVGTGALAESDIDPWAEDLSKITFDGDAAIDATETGAGARYNSDVIFNKGLAINSEENAFYAESAGRIQAMASGVDKVVKGNMLALNGQIDALFDTTDSSFTGTTELQNIEKVFSWDDEEEYDDEDVDVDTYAADDEESDDSDDGDDWEVPFIDETPRINITLQNGAVWNVTGDSSLTNLANDAFVNLSDANRTGTGLTAQTLSGT